MTPGSIMVRALLLSCLLASASAYSIHAGGRGPLWRSSERASVRCDMPPAASRLLSLLRDRQSEITFPLVMETIDELYEVREVGFSVGEVVSEPGQNMGTAKILSFARISGLEARTTLNLFGDYYRKDVLESPDGSEHANIRAFMEGGWECVAFPDGLALTPKTPDSGYVAQGPNVEIDSYSA